MGARCQAKAFLACVWSATVGCLGVRQRHSLALPPFQFAAKFPTHFKPSLAHAQSAAGVLLSECAAWAQRHHTALAAVREGAIPGLTLSPVSGPAGATSVSGKAAWCCADADALLGLLSPVPAPSDSAAGLTAQQGASNRAGLLTEALGPAAAAPYLPQVRILFG